MKFYIYAIQDKKVGFMQPITDVSDQSAMRNFSYGVNSGGIMNYSPKDFDLYRIGSFDSDKGTIEPCPIPELIVTGVNVFNDKDV